MTTTETFDLEAAAAAMSTVLCARGVDVAWTQLSETDDPEILIRFVYPSDPTNALVVFDELIAMGAPIRVTDIGDRTLAVLWTF
jgi:hypothetical protein